MVLISSVSISGGCTSLLPSQSEPLTDDIDCEDTGKPTPSVEQGVEQSGGYDSIGSARYPEPPEQWSRDAAKRFVGEYETSYQQNTLVQRYEKSLIDLTLTNQEQNLITSTGNRYTIRFDYMLGYEWIDDQGELVSTGARPEAVVYSVDSTAVIRTTTSHEFDITDEVLDDSPDPVADGDVLDCFEL